MDERKAFEEAYADSQRRAAEFNEKRAEFEEQRRKEAEEKRILEEKENLRRAELLKAGRDKEKIPEEQDSGTAVYRGIEEKPEDSQKPKTSEVDELAVETIEGGTDKNPLDDDIAGAGEK